MISPSNNVASIRHLDRKVANPMPALDPGESPPDTNLLSQGQMALRPK